MLKKMNKCISMQIKRFFKEKLIQHSDAAFAKITKNSSIKTVNQNRTPTIQKIKASTVLQYHYVCLYKA